MTEAHLLSPLETPVPTHVAIIMDGNGRWAQERGQPRLKGHEAGAESVRTVLKEAKRLGVAYLTLYAFSTENWQRPQDEVGGLMDLLSQYLNSETAELLENGVRLKAIGDIERLPPELRELLRLSAAATAHNTAITLTLALSYGSRLELVRAMESLAREVAAGALKPEDLTEETIAGRLWTRDMPDPDLLIRTGGEMRVSNFLLWQIAYAELYLSPILWPDFRAEAFRQAIRSFQGRQRRFGRTSGQVAT